MHSAKAENDSLRNLHKFKDIFANLREVHHRRVCFSQRLGKPQRDHLYHGHLCRSQTLCLCKCSYMFLHFCWYINKYVIRYFLLYFMSLYICVVQGRDASSAWEGTPSQGTLAFSQTAQHAWTSSIKNNNLYAARSKQCSTLRTPLLR